ncbi:uncharacterized protein LOC126668528 [Mercurialis annua]|uniref:uncharacterized protein LOC126668528 n=1 Tax=Mercurialis annua TaxID=3986 RepID=UPI0024ADBE52|nr:uncharacterized protein LOC126668528 [Mercurialis annua]
MRDETMDATVASYMKCFSNYLPKYLKQFDFYSMRNSQASFALCSSFDSRYNPFTVVNVADLPIQSNSDCGAFVCLFAEYFIDSKPIPPTFSRHKMELYRNCLTQDLVKYGRWKIEKGYSSNAEGTVKLRRELRKKKT